MHEKRFLIGDMKFSNLLVSFNAENLKSSSEQIGRLNNKPSRPCVVMNDLGSSIKLKDGQDFITTTKAFGTRSWIAPEGLVRGEKTLGPEFDIYQLGLMILRFYDGFEADCDHTSERTRVRFRHVPHDLRTLVRRCLQFSPSARPRIEDFNAAFGDTIEVEAFNEQWASLMTSLFPLPSNAAPATVQKAAKSAPRADRTLKKTVQINEEPSEPHVLFGNTASRSAKAAAATTPVEKPNKPSPVSPTSQKRTELKRAQTKSTQADEASVENTALDLAHAILEATVLRLPLVAEIESLLIGFTAFLKSRAIWMESMLNNRGIRNWRSSMSVDRFLGILKIVYEVYLRMSEVSYLAETMRKDKYTNAAYEALRKEFSFLQDLTK